MSKNFKKSESVILAALGLFFVTLVSGTVVLFNALGRTGLEVFTLALLCLSSATVGMLGFILARVFKRNNELVRSSGEENHAAMHDPLTGVANRRQFEIRLERLAAQENPKHALLMMDLDRFKPVNDLFGHAAGDALLVEIAKGLTKIVSSKDIVARLGGDEFVLLLESTDQQIAQAVALRAVNFINKYRLTWEGQRVSVGASIGMMFIDNDSHTPANLMTMADEALYTAKEAGRGVVFQAIPPQSLGEPVTFVHIGADVNVPIVSTDKRPEGDSQQKEMLASDIVYLPVPAQKADARTGSRRRHLIKHWVLLEPRTKGDAQSPGMQTRELITEASSLPDGGADLARWIMKSTLNGLSLISTDETNQIGFVIPIPAKAVIQSPTLGEELMRINALAQNPLRHFTFLLYGVGSMYDAPELQEFQNRIDSSGGGLAFEITTSTLDALAPIHHIKFEELYLGRELTRNLRPKTPALAAIESLLSIVKQHQTSVVAHCVDTEQEVRNLVRLGAYRFSGPFIGEALPFLKLMAKLKQADLDAAQNKPQQKSA